MHRLVLIAIAAATTALHAQRAAPPKRPQLPEPETCSIEGRVINAVSGEGVRKAEIVMYAGENRSYTTNSGASGMFAMRDIEPGRYHVAVSKRGYARLEYGARRAGLTGATLSVDSGQHLRDLVLAMSPQAVITGHVLDEEGDPVPYANVQLLKYDFARGKRRLGQMDDVTTNDLGEYRLFGLSPGKYYLSVTSEGDGMGAERFGDQTSIPTYYPRAVDPAGATAIELQPGSILRGVDLVLLKTRAVRVRGRVVDPTTKQATQGLASSGVSVQLNERESSRWEDRSFGASSLDSQGNFEIRGVPPGAYIIQAFKPMQDKHYSAQQLISVGESDIENILLELTPATELKGQLRLEGRGTASLTEAHVYLQTEPGFTFGWPGGRVKADGGLVLANVVPGTHYELNVSGLPDDYYLKSARLGDTDVLAAGIEFTGTAAGQLEVVMSGNGGQVEGIVLNADDQPVPAATVGLIPDEPGRSKWRLYKQASTDQYGRFLIKGIAPGSYRVFAWEEMAGDQYEDPEFMKSCEALGHPVAIREGGHESAQLKLIPAAEKKTAN